MFARLAGLAYAHSSKSKREPLEDPEDLKILSSRANIFSFRTYPWNLWLFACVVLSIALFLNYFLYFKAKENDKGYLLMIVDILLYYITFFIIYAGKIEKLTIDKKKGIIYKVTVNIFLSKEEKTKNIDEVNDIQILHKGSIRHSGDYTRYYIRFTFKDNESIVFGETFSFLNVQYKYRQCMALIKGVVIPEVVGKNKITDETIDETSRLL